MPYKPKRTNTGGAGHFSMLHGWVQTKLPTGSEYSWLKRTELGHRSGMQGEEILPDDVWDRLTGYLSIDRVAYVEWKYYATEEAAMEALKCALEA